MTMTGDIAIVLLILGPDLTARQWSDRLRVSLAEVKAIALAEGVTLGDDPTPAPEERPTPPARDGRPPKFAPYEDRQIAARHRMGESQKALASQYGVHITTIRSALRRAGEAA